MVLNPEITEIQKYQGQFGEFTIEKHDRTGVILYRSGLIVSAISFAIGATLALLPNPNLALITLCYGLFNLGLGLSLFTIHIYMIALHRTLQIFWGIGVISSLIFAFQHPEPLPLWVYQHPLSILGVGFIFAALTGVYFKEGFCFRRLETKILTPLVPILLLGHLTSLLPFKAEAILLAIWAVLFLVFALRKIFQQIPDDIGDKSVFEYLKSRH